MNIGTNPEVTSTEVETEETRIALPVLDDALAVAQKMASGQFDLTPLEEFKPDAFRVLINSTEFVLHPKSTSASVRPPTQPASPPEVLLESTRVQQAVQLAKPVDSEEWGTVKPMSRPSTRPGPQTPPKVLRERHPQNPYKDHQSTRSYKSLLFDEIALRGTLTVNDTIAWFRENAWVKEGESENTLKNRVILKLGDMLMSNLVTTDGAGTFEFVGENSSRSDTEPEATVDSNQAMQTLEGLDFEFIPE